MPPSLSKPADEHDSGDAPATRLSAREICSSLFAVRFPIVTALLLLLLPILRNWIVDLLVMSRWEIAMVTVLALLTAWCCAFCATVLLEATPSRSLIPALRFPSWLFRQALAWSSALAIPIIVSLLLGADDKTEAALMVAVGVVLASIVLWLAATVYRRLAASRSSGSNARWRLIASARDDRGRAVHAGAVFLFVLFVLITLASLMANRLAGWSIEHGRVLHLLPTLGFFELLILQWALPLAIGSLLLDRYRVPVLLALALWVAVPELISGGPMHYFTVTPARCASADHTINGAECSRPVAIDEALEPWLREEERRTPGRKPTLLVVAASGGGIYASAWAARVLTGLQQEFGPRFIHSIRFVSAVSGGSVAAMYFVASYDPQLGAPSADQLEYINQASALSSNRAVAWGLLRFNLIRLLFPLADRINDRGAVLEETWANALLWQGHRHRISARLSDWRKGVREGWLPATAFNATLMESLQPLLLSTVAVPAQWGHAVLFGEGEEGYAGTDIDVVTAVRLSASFAWVSPLAIARFQGGDSREPLSTFHVGDGGYYDGSGVEAALAWSQAVMRNYRQRLNKIIILQIRSEPHTPPVDPMRQFVQSVQPAATAVRELSLIQQQRNQADIEHVLSVSEGFIDTLILKPSDYTVKAWALSPPERAQIESDWQNLKQSQEILALGALFER
ncbi:MAG TPA: hypothetical protein VJX23_15065 [Candidatus Binataceae bacterium]|nr:hypothetical protein [Candidatus Binataceae bacterium]